MRLIEINGIKLEIDERTARTVEQYKVGDKVKVLVKDYASKYTICPGVIIGFSPFEKLPTIEVMYANSEAWDSSVFKTACINANNNDVELAPFNDVECLLDKQHIIDKFDRAIRTKQIELDELSIKRDYFIKRFATAFESVTV